MGDGIDHAAIEQAGEHRREGGIGRIAVAAIGILEERGGAVLRQALRPDQADGNPGAVARGGPDAFGDVFGGIIARHRLDLEHAALAGLVVHFIGGGRRHQRIISVAQPFAARLLVGAERHGIGGLVGRDREGLGAGDQDPQLLVALGALLDGEEAVEGLEVLDEGVAAGRNQVPPRRAAMGEMRVARRHQPVVGRLPVGADDPAVAEMIGLIKEVALARGDHCEAGGVRGGCAALLVADCAVQIDADIPVVGRAADAHVIGVVLLLVDQPIGRGGRTEDVRLHALGEQSDGILLEVEDRPVVAGPDHAALDIGDAVREGLAGREVLHLEHILAAADGIERIGEQPVVRAHRAAGDLEEAVALGHGRLVEDHFLGCLQTALAPREDRIVGAGGEAGVVIIAALQIGDRAVVLLDVPDNLSIDLVRQRLLGGEHGVGIGVLGLEMGQHLRVFPRIVAQPVIFVVAGGAEGRLDRVRLLRGDGRDGRGQGCGLGERGKRRAGGEQGGGGEQALHGGSPCETNRGGWWQAGGYRESQILPEACPGEEFRHST